MKPSKIVMRTCKECNRIFFVKEWKTSKFCSRKCYLKDRENTHKKCELCNRIIPRKLSGNKRRFCSRECLYNSMKGDKSKNWKGGRLTRPDGYVYCYTPDHPYNHDKYVLEHRLVMEKILGRYLEKDEVVHHINGIKSDNRPENLQLLHKYHGKGQVYRCNDCGSFNVQSIGR